MTGTPFVYRCEICSAQVETEYRLEPRLHGPVRCPDHPVGFNYRERAKAVDYESRRDQGAIVTLIAPDGELHVQHEPGLVGEAVSAILAQTPDTWQVLSISTPGTILRDLTAAPPVDPQWFEKLTLGELGLGHRLHAIVPRKAA